MKTRLDERPWLWLLLGSLLVVAANFRFGIHLLGWLAPIPWLRYLRLTRGWRSRTLFAAVLFAAWCLAMLKIVTPPVPPLALVGFALPILLFQGAPLLVWSAVRRRLAPALAAPFYAAAVAAADFSQHAWTEFGTWSSLAYTQLDNPAALQLVSLGGMSALSFAVALVAVLLEEALDQSAPRPLGAATAVLVAVHAFGALRLAGAESRGRPTVKVAAVATDSDVTGPSLPGRSVTEKWDEALLARSRRAAASGAQLVVWPEAATLVRPEDETTWVERRSAEAVAMGVDLVAGYVVPLSENPFRFGNRLVVIDRRGRVRSTFNKHHPVPGEPAVAGKEPLVPVDLGYARVATALCYDYDFPSMGLAHAAAGATLVAVPSSDWRGIDPTHSQMAAVRAIESGHSVLRSTRWGLSVGVDPWGRMRGWQSSFDANDGVMVVSLPSAREPTLYGRVGNAPVALAFIYLGGCLALALRRRARGISSPAGARGGTPAASDPSSA